MNRIKKLIPYLIPLLFVVGLPLGDALYEEFTNPFKTWVASFGINWLYPFVLVGVSVLFGIPLAVDYRNKLNNKNIESFERDIKKIRKRLVSLYQERIDFKLIERLPINIELKATKEGSNSREDLINVGIKTYEATNINIELIKLFYEYSGRILIIGEPGAGKTTVLLEFANKLLENEKDRIPFVANVVSWRNRFDGIEDWLFELFVDDGMPRQVAKNILHKNIVIPLFDGLDELPSIYRDDFIRALRDYSKRREVNYVICSRSNEYYDVEDAPISCQLKVMPLTISQIKSSLIKRKFPEADSIIDAIGKDSILAKVVENPFYFNLIQYLFSDMSSIEYHEFKSKTLEGRQYEIVDKFCRSQINKLEKFDLTSTNKWLGFIAYRMEIRGGVTFELRDVQFNWFRSNNNIIKFFVFLIAELADGLAYGLGLGVMFGLLFSKFYDYKIGLFSGLIIGVVLGIIAAIVVSIGNIALKAKININPKNSISWSTAGFVDYFRKNMDYALYFAFCYGAIFLIVIGLSLGFFYGVVFGLLSFFVVVFITCSPGLLVADSSKYLKVKYPYQRFVTALKYLDFSILQHFILRVYFFKIGLLPLQVSRFLESLTNLHIVESQGGAWRFRHRILREYFADNWWDLYEMRYPDGRSENMT